MHASICSCISARSCMARQRMMFILVQPMQEQMWKKTCTIPCCCLLSHASDCLPACLQEEIGPTLRSVCRCTQGSSPAPLCTAAARGRHPYPWSAPRQAAPLLLCRSSLAVPLPCRLPPIPPRAGAPGHAALHLPAGAAQDHERLLGPRPARGVVPGGEDCAIGS